MATDARDAIEQKYKKHGLVNATIDVERSATEKSWRGSKTVIMSRAVSGFAVADERAEDYGRR